VVRNHPAFGHRRASRSGRGRPGPIGVLASKERAPLISHERHPQLPKDEVKRLLRELRRTDDPSIRARLIESHLGLVEYLARRFAGRGEPLDDLVQVGTIGLVKAVDRFDPSREVEFSTYATPTIVGELKRHFRDKGWAVRVPRRLQELNLRMGPVIAGLSQELQRSPTVAEIAKAADASEDEILEALDSAHAYSLVSLDAASSASEEGLSYHEQIGSEDEALHALEDRLSVGPLLRKLPPRDRLMLNLRFFKGMTQSEIAEQLGISQMHVSRLLAKTLVVLREALEDAEHDPREA
jgi:RNA polymerase sigma-B factor